MAWAVELAAGGAWAAEVFVAGAAWEAEELVRAGVWAVEELATGATALTAKDTF